MNSIQKVVESIIDNHLIKALFTVKLAGQCDGEVTLHFKMREDAIHSHQGATGLMIDCAARSAGYWHIGPSFLAECETHIRVLPHAREFIARAGIAQADQNCATFYCEIYSKPNNKLVAESQGTLLKAKPALARVA